MRVRYSQTDKGKLVKQAEIYTAEEHGIRTEHIDRDALKIIRRLRQSGHAAYVVGGAIRDLLVGRSPKDFDVSTDAPPGRIRRLFRNSRVIGRRFKLVHIFFGDKIIEVSTFRARSSGGFNPVYGELEEDVHRRDFTANALYYDPADESILDFVGGLRDIQKRRLNAVIPLEEIFAEDPVRMVRAIKYSVVGGLKPTKQLKRQIRKQSQLLEDCPTSRLTEESLKILLSGKSQEIFSELLEYDLLQHFLPQIARLLNDRDYSFYRDAFFERLGQLDEVKSSDEVTRPVALAYLLADFLFLVSQLGRMKRIPFKEAFTEAKHIIRPLTPPNADIEAALVLLMRRKKKYREQGRL